MKWPTTLSIAAETLQLQTDITDHLHHFEGAYTAKSPLLFVPSEAQSCGLQLVSDSTHVKT